jgi:DNA repair protein RecO (recombination protein O)
VSTEKSLAIVIRQADFSESSRVVTLFTRDFGKVAALAKGAKRLKGPFEAALDLLAICEVVFIRKSSSGLDILTEAQLKHRFRPRPGDLGSLYGGYYVAELLDSLSEEYDPHPLLFDEAVQTLERLSGDAPLDVSILRFEFVILREIGQLPAFDVCTSCGEPVVGSAGRYGFQASQGGIICQNCFGDDAPRFVISAGAVGAMRTLASESAEAVRSLAATSAQLREMRTVTNAAIAHTLGRRPKTLRYLPL